MLVSLLKTAREMERFALDAESDCRSLTKLLHPAFNSYNVPPPILPIRRALSEYTLEYDPAKGWSFFFSTAYSLYALILL